MSLSCETKTPVSSEAVLRRHLVQQINNINPQPIIDQVRDFRPNIDVGMIVSVLIQVINSASRGKQWCCNSANCVEMGYFTSDSDFFTLLLHETGHGLLGLLDPNNTSYSINPDPEEDWCWDFSKTTCKAIGIPPHHQRINLFMTMWQATKNLANNPNDPTLDLLFMQERRFFGCSYYDADQFYWLPDGQPQLLTPLTSMPFNTQSYGPCQGQ